MDLTLTLLMAGAVIAALCALAFMVGDVMQPMDLNAAPKLTQPTIAEIATPCKRDGVLITSMDRLRMAVTLTDTLILRGDLSGRKLGMQVIRADADQFARSQTSPDVTLAMLERCDETLLHRYPHGYWLLSAALVRESARRRGVVAP